MTDQQAFGPVKRVQLEAVIVRADGTREDLGVVADSKWKLPRWLNIRRARAHRRTENANRRLRDR
jgi:hypothetical protein